MGRRRFRARSRRRRTETSARAGIPRSAGPRTRAPRRSPGCRTRCPRPNSRRACPFVTRGRAYYDLLGACGPPVGKGAHELLSRLGRHVLLTQRPHEPDRLAHLLDVDHASVAVEQVLLEAPEICWCQAALEVVRHHLDELLARHLRHRFAHRRNTALASLAPSTVRDAARRADWSPRARGRYTPPPSSTPRCRAT